MNNGGFTLGGRTAHSLGLHMLRSSQRPILPGTVDRTMAIPGRNGEWDFGADIGPRPFQLDCAVLSPSAEALQQVVSNLAAALMTIYGKPKEQSLVFDYQPDREYTVRYSGNLPIDRLVGLGKFTLPLIAYDPFAYGSTQLVEQTITDSPEIITVYSGGNVVAEPVLMITNTGLSPVSGFSIINEYEIE
ncbi:distal tail protein Dit [Paenibacillus sp. HJGM_3]|uniref:distal tail protein Dit n=1 Tax=Paenibacillus sp. HJGM_3 TaxID=3379816 RepID=UPI00385A1E0F